MNLHRLLMSFLSVAVLTSAIKWILDKWRDIDWKDVGAVAVLVGVLILTFLALAVAFLIIIEVIKV